MDQELLTAEELAGKLKVEPLTIYRMVKRGALPVIRIGRNMRFDYAEVVAHLKKHQGQAEDTTDRETV